MDEVLKIQAELDEKLRRERETTRRRAPNHPAAHLGTPSLLSIQSGQYSESQRNESGDTGSLLSPGFPSMIDTAPGKLTKSPSASEEVQSPLVSENHLKRATNKFSRTEPAEDRDSYKQLILTLLRSLEEIDFLLMTLLGVITSSPEQSLSQDERELVKFLQLPKNPKSWTSYFRDTPNESVKELFHNMSKQLAKLSIDYDKFTRITERELSKSSLQLRQHCEDTLLRISKNARSLESHGCLIPPNMLKINPSNVSRSISSSPVLRASVQSAANHSTISGSTNANVAMEVNALKEERQELTRDLLDAQNRNKAMQEKLSSALQSVSALEQKLALAPDTELWLKDKQSALDQRLDVSTLKQEKSQLENEMVVLRSKHAQELEHLSDKVNISLSEYQKTLANREEDVEQIQESLSRAEAVSEGLREELRLSKAQLVAETRAHADVRASLHESEILRQDLEEELGTLRPKLDSLKREHLELQRTLRQDRDTIGDLQRELGVCESEIAMSSSRFQAFQSATSEEHGLLRREIGDEIEKRLSSLSLSLQQDTDYLKEKSQEVLNSHAPINQSIAVLSTRLQEITGSVDQLNGEDRAMLSVLQDDFRAAFDHITEMQQELRSMTDLADSYKSKSLIALEELKQTKRESRRITERAEELEADCIGLEERVVSLKEECRVISAERDDWKKKVHEMEHARKDDLEHSRQQFDLQQQLVATTRQSAEEWEDKYTQLHAEFRNVSERMNSMLPQMAALEETRDVLKNELEVSQGKVSDLSVLLEKYQGQCDDAKEDFRECREALLEAKKEARKNTEIEAEGFQSRLMEEKSRRQEIVAEYIAETKELRASIEDSRKEKRALLSQLSTLEQTLRALLAENEDLASQVKELSQNSILAAEQLDQLEDALTKRCVVSKKIQEILCSTEDPAIDRAASISEQWSADDERSIVLVNSLKADLNAQVVENAKLKEQLSSVENERQQLDSSIVTLEKELSSCKLALCDSRNCFSQLCDEVEDSKQELQRMHAVVEKHQQDLQRTEQDSEVVKNAMDRRIRTMKSLHSDISEQISAFPFILEERAALQHVIAVQEETIVESRKREAAAESRMQHLDDERSQLTEEISELKSKLAEYAEESRFSSRHLGTAIDDLRVCKEKLAESEALCTTQSKSLDEKQACLENAERELLKARARLEELEPLVERTHVLTEALHELTQLIEERALEFARIRTEQKDVTAVAEKAALAVASTESDLKNLQLLFSSEKALFDKDAQRLAELQRSFEALMSTHQHLMVQYTEVQDKNVSLERQCEESRLEIIRLSSFEHIESLLADEKALNRTLSETVDNLRMYVQKCQELEVVVKKEKTSNEELRRQSSQLSEELSSVKESLLGKESTCARLEASTELLEVKLEHAMTSKEDAQREWQEGKVALKELQEKCAQMEVLGADQEQQLGSLSAALDRTEEALRESKASVNVLSTEIQAVTSKNDKISGELSSLGGEHEALLTLFEETKVRADELENISAQLKQQLGASQEAQASMEVHMDALKKDAHRFAKETMLRELKKVEQQQHEYAEVVSRLQKDLLLEKNNMLDLKAMDEMERSSILAEIDSLKGTESNKDAKRRSAALSATGKGSFARTQSSLNNL
mgnify:CR=1 FL=1|jgi:chromosome segregation ATPase